MRELGDLVTKLVVQRQVPRQDLRQGHHVQALRDRHHPQRGERVVVVHGERAVVLFLVLQHSV